MIKTLLLRLKQCFGPFTMLPVEGSSETELFRHSSNHVFRSLYFCKYINYEGHRFLKMFKIACKFKNLQEYSEKLFASGINASDLEALNCLY